MTECIEISNGSVCFRAKQLIQEERDKADELKFDYEQAKNIGFMTAIFCALHILHVHGCDTQAREIIQANTSLSEMQSYVLQHGSEIDNDALEWATTL